MMATLLIIFFQKHPLKSRGLSDFSRTRHRAPRTRQNSCDSMHLTGINYWCVFLGNAFSIYVLLIHPFTVDFRPDLPI